MKKITLLLLAFFCLHGLYAQKRPTYIISYSIGFPVPDLSNYISSTSFRGVTFEFNKRIKPKMDVGLEVGWNVFYEREAAKVYTDEPASISGVQYRYTNSVPMLADFKYYLGASTKPVKIYAGAGLGALYSNRSTDFGLYNIKQEVWQFCLRPEAGVVIPTKKGIGIVTGVKYYGAFSGSELDGQSYVTLNIGIVF